MKQTGPAFLLVYRLVVVLVASPVLADQVSVVDGGPNHLRVLFEASEDSWRSAVERRHLIGIPLTGEVDLKILDVIVGVTVDADAANADEVLSELDLDGPASLGEPGFMRDQRVIPLMFKPIRLADGTLETYRRVVVELGFNGHAGPGSVEAADSWGETLYRRNVLNYVQAQAWRQSPGTPSSAKAALQDPDIQRVRMTLREEGMYRVTGADLEDIGIRLEDVDAANLRVLYGGGRMLRLVVSPVDFQPSEVAAVVQDGSDGRFDRSDYVLFYGQSVDRWVLDGTGKYVFVKNNYTEDNVYFLEIGGDIPGKRAEERSGILISPTAPEISRYRARFHQESDNLILFQTFGINSGYQWYWEDFTGNARNYRIVVEGAVDAPVDIRLGFFGWTNFVHEFDVKWNGESVDRVSWQGTSPRIIELETESGVIEGVNSLGLFHQDRNLTRFDWYELEYSRNLLAQRGELNFDSPVFDGIAQFRFEGFAEQPRVFDYSAELAEVVDFEFDADLGTVRFQYQQEDIPPRFLALDESRWKRPNRLELSSAEGLQSGDNRADYVIVAHGDFLNAAERLADWRRRDDRFGEPLTPKVVDVQAVYDEFSGGLLDPTAIRDFIKYASDNWEMPPFFIVLFGDGTYDYKNNSGTSSGNWIPAYQEGDSTYDEWYVRVSGGDGLPDLAIGRLTVQTSAEADLVVDKLITYDQQPEAGPWQSRILIVADDILNPSKRNVPESMFLQDAETLSKRFMPVGLDVIKHYIGRFPLEGQTKPRARDEFIRLFNDGAVILTYVGHGNPEVLAHEQMFVLSRDQSSLNNGSRLPFFYTAASQVGVFDDPVRISMPESFLLMPNGGVIGMISATRVGFHTSNMVLANRFHELMYRTENRHVPVGAALMEAKIRSPDSVDGHWRRNIRRYSLIGDPATRLAIPRYQVSINIADTLRALQEVKVEAEVLDAEGGPVPNYNGQAWVQAFDSTERSKLDNLSFLQPGATLFRGLFPVVNGRVTAEFRVPKDITYRGEEGRISVYLANDHEPAAFGSVEQLNLAGTAQDVTPDQDGPQIKLVFEGQEGFTSGGFVSATPVLRASVWDVSGINVTGETGHEISLSIDGIVTKVTDFFSSTDEKGRGGELEFQLPTLESGKHAITLKAWDTFNNSAEAEVEVQVGEEGEVVLTDLLFYPNPFDGSSGHFTMNLFSPAASLEIQIFSLTGKLVDEIRFNAELGYNQIEWTPTSDLASGTYLYKVAAMSEDEEGRLSRAEQTSALQIMR